MSSVVNFPRWKNNCTAAEKLREVLQYAESKPEEVRHVIIIFEGSDGVRQMCVDYDLTVVEALGLLDLAKHDLRGYM